jgi:CubicO group peptidase (beta-lactamase class C family)
VIEERIGKILGRSAARHPGLVVGVRAGDGETGVWSRGVEADAVFEIGSITKTFTATVLASMVRDGLVALDDPVAQHLPVEPPTKGRRITLEDLATHRSGLPRLPAGVLVQGYTTARHNPYAGLDDQGMREAIAKTRPKRAPGSKVAYSNYGYGLLGYALARRAGTTYVELVRDRITGPLGLAHTALDTPGLTQGHGFFGRATPAWDLASLAGAGGLRSTARDLLAYLAIHSSAGPLADAARDTRVKRASMGKLGIGLGWIILPADSGPPWVRLEHETLMHDGGTGGFRSYASVVPETGKAVVVIGSRARSVTNLGVKLMRAL